MQQTYLVYDIPLPLFVVEAMSGKDDLNTRFTSGESPLKRAFVILGPWFSSNFAMKRIVGNCKKVNLL